MKVYRYCVLLIIYLFPLESFAQNNQGSGSFLTITPEVRSVEMGGTGVASDKSFFMGCNNPASALFSNIKGGIAYAYSPWMRDVVKGNDFHAVSAFHRFGKNVLLVDVRHLKHSSVELRDNYGNAVGSIIPREQYYSLGYARQLGGGLGIGTNIKCIISDFTVGNLGNVARAIAFDFGVYYQQHFEWTALRTWRIGLKLSDLGNKLDYGFGKYELPGRVILGSSFTVNWSEKHNLEGELDFGYLFLPNNSNVFSTSFGMEYCYNSWGAVRLGYHVESKDCGNFASAGIGVNWNCLQLDGNYIFAGKGSVLNNTWMMSIGIDWGIFVKDK